jgi:arginase family enzyme
MPGAPDQPIQPVSGTLVPRFAGPSTFARLPELRDVRHCDVAILGIPFDTGTSYRPGARFGPQAIRQASRHLRTQYHPAYNTEPFRDQQVADRRHAPLPTVREPCGKNSCMSGHFAVLGVLSG